MILHRLFHLMTGAKMSTVQKEEPKEIEISLMAVRNGDHLGHEHLDSLNIYVGGYTITIDKENICIKLPVYVSVYPGALKQQEINEKLVVNSMGHLTRIFKIGQYF